MVINKDLIICLTIIMFAFILLGIFPKTAVAVKNCEFLLSDLELAQRSDHLKKILRYRDFSTLEDQLSTRQARIERGEDSDEFLRLEFDETFESSPEIEPLLTEWVTTYPLSYTALVARAYHYIASGYSKRGNKFASITSKEQFASMEQQFKKAVADLNLAITLSDKPTLAYAKKILLVRASHNYGSIIDIVNEANYKFPRSLAIKIATVSTLNPKWGGSFEAMDKLLELAETAKMPANEIRYLNYKIELEKANYYSVVTEQKTLAASHYELAGGFCENRWIWEKIVQTSYETSDWPKLIEAADRLIKIEPANGYAFQRRGWAFEKTNQMARAVKDYEIAAKLGLPWAQNKLGWILWQGIDLPKDLPRAKKLFLKATGQGDEYAKANLKALNAVLGE